MDRWCGSVKLSLGSVLWTTRCNLPKTDPSLCISLCVFELNIWERAFSACCVHVCLHIKASGEAHLSTRQHIKAFIHCSERPTALGLLYLSPMCLETTKRLHLCDSASEFMI